MAVLKMKRVLICGLNKDRKKILEMLQRRGIVEVNDRIPVDNVFQKSDVSTAKNSFEKSIASTKEAVEILNTFNPEKKSMLSTLNGRKLISADVYDSFQDKYDSIRQIALRIISLNKEIAEKKAEVIKLQTQIEMISPWISLDIPLDFTGTKNTRCLIGTLPNLWTLEAIYEKLAEHLPVDVEIISESKDQTCIFVLCNKEKADAVFEILREMEFSLPNLTFDKAPAEQLNLWKEQIEGTKKAIDDIEMEIKSYAKNKEDLMFLQDYDTMRADKYEVISHLAQSRNSFILTGFIPEKEEKLLTEDLNQRFQIAIEFSEPEEEEEVPVQLSNNEFSGPLESVLEGFSLPNKNEIDPTMIMSLFYYALFGIMLADAGYGSIMVAGCAFGLIKYKKTLENSMRRTLKMFLYCGISTIFWGVMFGSYFGDLLDVITETFFGNKITIPPLWFFPVNQPMRMLAFSMIIGLIHILTGLSMKFYQLLKQKDYKSIVYDAVSWFVLIVSSTMILLSLDMVKGILGVKFTIPSIGIKVFTVLALISAACIVLTNGRESRNPLKRILKGAYALYGITGYLSDVLSYSRLLALGLASGIICSVINKMAGMAGTGLLGPVIFSLIIIFGHLLNIAINALGAYVHTNRLQYVEFFGKFYEGGGRKFNPFGENTKYYKVKE